MTRTAKQAAADASAREVLSQFASERGLDAQGLIALVTAQARRQLAAHAAAGAKADNALYTHCFGAHAAAYDVPVLAPATSVHRATTPYGSTPATATTQAQLDALYAAFWPERATTRC